MITISGYSDDIVSIETDDGNSDELDDCAAQTERSILVGTEEAGLIVRVTYAPGDEKATWRIAVDLVDEDVRIPWPVRIENGDRGYTPALVIDCPKGTPWKQIGKKKKR